MGVRVPVATVAVVLLVVAAGCGGSNPLDGSGDGGGGEAPDGGPAGGTTGDVPPPGDVPDPPGVTEGRVENASALLAAHREQLAGLSSYAVVLDSQQDEYTTRVELRVSNDDRQYGGVVGGDFERRLYFEDGTEYRRDVDGSVTTRDAPFEEVHGLGSGLLRSVDNAEITVENTTTVAGRTVVTYRITDFDPEGDTQVGEASGRLQVTPDGLILAFVLSAATTGGNRLSVDYRISSTGEVTVDRPDWADEGRVTETPGPPALSLSFDVREDGRVEIVHEGGETADALTVTYAVDGETVTETWRPDGGVTAGATYVTDRAPDAGSSVRVLWKGDGRSTLLAEYTLP